MHHLYNFFCLITYMLPGGIDDEIRKVVHSYYCGDMKKSISKGHGIFLKFVIHPNEPIAMIQTFVKAGATS